MARLADDFMLYLAKPGHEQIKMTMTSEEFLIAGSTSVAAGVGFRDFIASVSPYELPMEISLDETDVGDTETVDQLDDEIEAYFLRLDEDMTDD